MSPLEQLIMTDDKPVYVREGVKGNYMEGFLRL